MFNENDRVLRSIVSASQLTGSESEIAADATELENIGIRVLTAAKFLLSKLELVPDDSSMPGELLQPAHELLFEIRQPYTFQTRRAQIQMHDWRNSIMRFVSYELNSVEQTCAALRYFIRHLDAFSPAEFLVEDNLELVDLVILINQQARAVRNRFPNRSIIVQMELNTETIFASSWPIIMCLHNLLFNADQASEPDKKILINLSNREFNRNELLDVWNGDAMKPGTFAALSVVDEGHGIDENIRQELFRNAISTKLNGTGTGLKYVAETVARYHGGASAESCPRGTTISMYFPLVPPRPKATP